MSVIRHRGRQLFVDTTHSAELELQGYQISDEQLERAANRLVARPLHPDDMVHGDVRIREIEGYDYLFFIGQNDEAIVVTIASVSPHEDRRFREALKTAGRIAILRGATGV